jgi:hypothetical protein
LEIVSCLSPASLITLTCKPDYLLQYLLQLRRFHKCQFPALLATQVLDAEAGVVGTVEAVVTPEAEVSTEVVAVVASWDAASVVAAAGAGRGTATVGRTPRVT